MNCRGSDSKGKNVRSLHAIAAEIRGIHLRRQNPCQTSIRAKEALVYDQSCNIGACCCGEVADRCQVATSNYEQADKEARQHRTGPESATELFHVKDGGNCAEEE